MHTNGIDETRELRESNKWAFSNITYKITSRIEKSNKLQRQCVHCQNVSSKSTNKDDGMTEHQITI